MALSKTAKIWIFLIIDTLFFLLEISIGYAAHSLALVADSFHMLNDVLSLCVGLWAVKVATERPSSKTFTYGWSRAETLGALINGVFLVALCLSIFLEAIQRFVEPQEVKNPKLVLIVGCFGLVFNILGLFLFHEHDHGHDEENGHAHDHDHLISAEEGHRTNPPITADKKIKDTDGSNLRPVEAIASEEPSVGDETMPDSRLQSWLDSRKTAEAQKTGTRETSITFAISGSAAHGDSNLITHTKSSSALSSRSRRSRASSRGSEQIPIHPASFRNEIIAQARVQRQNDDNSSDEELEEDQGTIEEEYEPSERSPLLKSKSSKSLHSHHSTLLNGNSATHHDHKHAQTNKTNSNGHSHGDMNMKGIFLHVLGDALGNVGVIASALIIWLTPWSFRFYFDPLISLCITVIILCSAIPLCKASSKILLQATPQHISVDDIKDDIESLSGVKSCHHLHVWQLTAKKLIASLHVQVDFDFQGKGAARYMELAKSMRACLHGYGIHSSTIQPEFCLDPEHEHNADIKLDSLGIPISPGTDDTVIGGIDGHKSPKRSGNGKSRAAAKDEGCGSGNCLLECSETCASGAQCCTPGSGAGSGTVTPKIPKDGDSK